MQQVSEIPGLGQLPYAETWFHEIDDARFRDASNGARALGKTGLEAWTTTRTPDVADFLRSRGYEEVRRYVISELELDEAADLGPPRLPLATFAERPDLERALFELARVAYADQPGRAGTSFEFESWREWGLHAHPPEAYFVALDGDELLGYGYLERRGEEWWNGFMAVAQAARGRGVAGAIKRAEVAWAKEHAVERLRTATEARLASMLDLNRRFGYRPLYEEIVLRGPLDDDTRR